MTDLNLNGAPKSTTDEQGKRDAGRRIVRKRPRINAPMPIPSPYERKITTESSELVRLYVPKGAK